MASPGKKVETAKMKMLSKKENKSTREKKRNATGEFRELAILPLTRTLDISQYWLRRSTDLHTVEEIGVTPMNFLLSRVQLCSNFAPVISHPAGPTPIKQIKFLPEIPTKKSQALLPSLGVLTSLVRDPCIVSIVGTVPYRGPWARDRMSARGEKRVLIEGGNRWKIVVSLGFYS